MKFSDMEFLIGIEELCFSNLIERVASFEVHEVTEEALLVVGEPS